MTSSVNNINLPIQTPPFSLECEESVIGSILALNAYEKVGDLLKTEHFYDPRHQEIFKSASIIYDKGQMVDMLTIVNYLKDNGKLDAVGGMAQLISLSQKSSIANIDYSAKVVFQKFVQRKLIHIGIQLQNWANDNTRDVEDTLNDAEQALFDVTDTAVSTEPMSIKECITRTHEEIAVNAANGGNTAGVMSGYRAIDEVTNGWQKGQLIVLAARPAMGKTAFALSMAHRMAYNNGSKVAIFSLEMSEKELVKRMLVAQTELEMNVLENGAMNTEGWARLNTAESRLMAKDNVFIDPSPGISISQLRSKARKLKRKHDIDIIIIDYLQLIECSGTDMKFGNRQEMVSHMSRQLKKLAKELDLPIVALCQLSRAVEGRPDKTPQLSDIRESGAIEQDADVVAFLHRPEYYGSAQDKNGQPLPTGTAYLMIKKNRRGRLEDIPLHFEPRLIRFDDFENEPNYGRKPTQGWMEKHSEYFTTSNDLNDIPMPDFIVK